MIGFSARKRRMIRALAKSPALGRQRPGAGAQRHGPDPDRPRRGRRAGARQRDRGAARRLLRRRLPRGHALERAARCAPAAASAGWRWKCPRRTSAASPSAAPPTSPASPSSQDQGPLLRPGGRSAARRRGSRRASARLLAEIRAITPPTIPTASAASPPSRSPAGSLGRDGQGRCPLGGGPGRLRPPPRCGLREVKRVDRGRLRGA